MNTRPVPLCLACSSSPSPKAQSELFTTPCCSRPICDRCLSRNPRLRVYNPCLACLGGVAVVGQSSSRKGKEPMQVIQVPGASGKSKTEEESMFVLGEDEDEEDSPLGDDAPPSYTLVEEITNVLPVNDLPGQAVISTEAPVVEGTNPSQYYIQPGDTLRGIALRFGIDGAKICHMNSLPLSTLSTTPHLLHTRRILELPPGKYNLPPPPIDPRVLEARKTEQAEKRFQFVTKEVDWRVAKTYVALAEGELDGPKSKEDTRNFRSSQAEGSRRVLEDAVEQYLEDEEWETQEGGEPRIQGFPLFSSRNISDKRSSETKGIFSRKSR